MKRLQKLIQANPIISLVIGFQLFRLVLLPFMGLMPQDAYYYFYGENLSLSYFDHPGMIGYILRLFTEIFGKSVFVIKLADFIISSLTLISFYYLASLFLSKQKLGYAMVLMASTVLISIVSFNSTPDVPLLLFWTLSLAFLFKAIFKGKNLYWILAGFSIGLALVSKYTAIFLLFGLLVFLVFSKKYLKLLWSPWLWISIVISTLVFSPVLWWNYQNNFVSFTFQISHRTDEISKFIFSIKDFFGIILSQLIVLLPILFLLIIVLTFKYIKKVLFKFHLPSDKILFLLIFFIPLFVGFFMISPFHWVKLNWLMPAYISGVIIASMYITKKALKIQVYFSVVVHVLLAIQVLFYLVPIKSDDTWVGWEELALEIENIQGENPDIFIFSGDNYKTTAELNFFMDENIYAENVIGRAALQYDYIGTDLSSLNGKNALFIDSDKRFKSENKKGKFREDLMAYFDKVIELEPIIIKKGDRKIRKFWVYYCIDYQYKNSLKSIKRRK